jgi:hypothetical protein
MTTTTYPAQRDREVHDRAEFDPDALADPTPLIPGTRQPVPDPRPTIGAVGIRADGRVTPYQLTARPGARARALSILVGVPTEVWRGHHEVPERACAGLDVIRLDRDLDLWFDIDGAERHPRNPLASVVAAGFGVHGGIYGPVMLTGATDTHGITTSIGAAACVFIASVATGCDGPHPSPARRARQFAALGIEGLGAPQAAIPAPRPEHERDDEPESVDALANTVTYPGDLPRCCECGQYGSHDECQPEVLADTTTH